jgi:hypothetical protein
MEIKVINKNFCSQKPDIPGRKHRKKQAFVQKLRVLRMVTSREG